MSVTISYRMFGAFVAGVAATVVALFVFQALHVDAAPGDVDATFVPIEPCRLIDTRTGEFHVGPHDTFGASDTKTIAAHGDNGDCTIPTDAVGLSLNVTALNATAPSFLTIWPDGERPVASSLNPVPGQPPTPNAVATNLSGSGSFNMFNLAGTVDVIVDVNGFYTAESLRDLDDRVGALETAGVPAVVLARLEALEADVASLKADNSALKAKTAAMSLEDSGATIRFTGVDVQIVDGSGDTQCNATGFEVCNGSGNLVVGYNEDEGGPEVRTGSHNIVAGTDNGYQKHSGIVTGTRNAVSGEYSTITGGRNNTASGDLSSVSGGAGNSASGEASSVSGGQGDTAAGDRSSVSGGGFNTSGGRESWVAGGEGNLASGIRSSVSGGQSNTASAFGSSVSGGQSNTAGAFNSSVSGGTSNIASGLGTSVLGGDSSEASGDYAVVVGGSENDASGPRAVVVGGGTNTASGSKAVVSGGSARSSTSTFDWRAGSLFEDQ